MKFPTIEYGNIKVGIGCETYIKLSEGLDCDTVFRIIDDIGVYGNLFSYSKGIWTFTGLYPYNLDLALKAIAYEFPKMSIRDTITGFEFYDSDNSRYYAYGSLLNDAYLDHSKRTPNDENMYTYDVYEITMGDEQ